MTRATVLVGVAAAGAAAVAAHTAINARLLRDPFAALPTAEDPARVGATRQAPSDGSSPPPRVSVLVPARDEADRIAPCIRSVLASHGVDLELVVCDDGSTDGTADVARAAAAGDPRLRVLTGRPLPPGWLGKPHACAQLVEAARGDVLAFCDADVVLAPRGLQAAVAELSAGPFDLVCPYPEQLADGAGPRLVQPLLQWTWLAFLPLRAAERRPRPSMVAANGQLMLTTFDAYGQAGGHAAVRDAVIEDVELGRAYVRAGLRAGVVDGTEVATCRMYGSWADARDGYTKSLWAAVGSPAVAVGVIGLLWWLFVLPPVAAVAGLRGGRRDLMVAGLAGTAAGMVSRAVSASRTGGRVRDAWTHPASVVALGWLTARSFAKRRAGTLSWRGRPVTTTAPSPLRAPS